MRNIIISILFFIGIIYGCSQSTSLKSENEELLKISNIYIFKKDSLNLKIKIINISKDTVIFPKNHYQINFIFEDSSIYRNNFSEVKIDYPVSNFENLKENEKKMIVKKLCRPLINLSDFSLIPPLDSIILGYNIYENGYKGFDNNKDYKYQCKVYISNSIKKFCPSIYSGTLIYNGEL